MELLTTFSPTVDQALQLKISEERKGLLQDLIAYIQNKLDADEEVNLNFICTHNSRRSQLSQIWAQVAAHCYDIVIHSYSGGVEVTEFNPRAVASMERFGFSVKKTGEQNPKYTVSFADGVSLECFSKIFDDPHNPNKDFAAVMTCSHADENCPFIPGAEARIPLRYEDPKVYDNTELESIKYDERSLQIASEMFYVFSKVAAG